MGDRTGQEQNHDHRRRDPERPVQVCVAFEDVEEVAARVYGCDAPAEDLVRVDVEELRVVVDGPPALLGGGAAGGSVAAAVRRTSAEEWGGVLLGFCVALVAFEVLSF